METKTIINLQDIRLPRGYKLWHFVSDRKWTPAEIEEMDKIVVRFLASWNAHGRALSAQRWWFMDNILSLGNEVSKGHSSGCSIDSMKAFANDLSKHFNFNWQPNNLLYCVKNTELTGMTKKEFKEAYAKGEISNDTVVFNSLLIDTTSSEENPLFPKLSNSWHFKLV